MTNGITRSGECFAQRGDVSLCYETFGDPGDPALLLISGMFASMDWWPDELCARLAAGRRYVIRYDFRDTGRSTSSPPGRPTYTGADLVSDPLWLLDHLGIGSAHLIGISMGSGIAMQIALDDPDRTRTLTLLSSSPAGPGGPDNPDLPPMDPELAELFRAAPPDWTDTDAVLEHLVVSERAFAGSLDVDEASLRAVLRRVIDRTTNIESSFTNHALIDGEGVPRDLLSTLAAPTLIIHGSDDPLFPPAHGEALAREIPGSELIILAGVGHQVPPPTTWDVVVPALLRHTAARGSVIDVRTRQPVVISGGRPRGCRRGRP